MHDNVVKTSTGTPVSATTPAKAAIAAWVGTLLEFYDFAIYAIAAALVFPILFFPVADPATGTIAALVAFGVGYLVRPLGAVLWGHLGDRFGRRPVLMLTMLTMGTATFLVGCLPSYEVIGFAAPILLLLLRITQGLSAAGEQPGANSVAFEHASAHRRGFYSSFATSGNSAGSLLANSVFLPLAAFLPNDQLVAWGWRIPFWISAALVVVGLVIRRRLDETPAFTREVAAGQVPSRPLQELFVGHWRALIRVVLLLLFTSVGSITSVWALSFGTKVAGVSSTVLLWAGIASTVVAQFVIPLGGLLSDRFGRRPVFAVGGLGMIGFLFPMLWAIGENNPPLIVVFEILTVGIFASLALSTVAALTGEMFPTRVRLSGSAIGLQVGIALGGGTAPVVAAVIATPGPGGWVPVAILCAVTSAVSIIAILTARETAGSRTPDLATIDLDARAPGNDAARDTTRADAPEPADGELLHSGDRHVPEPDVRRPPIGTSGGC